MSEALSTKVRFAERPEKTFLPNSAAINNEICEFANSHFLGLKHKAHSLRHYTPSHPFFGEVEALQTDATSSVNSPRGVNVDEILRIG
jgi:hypothetical protein